MLKELFASFNWKILSSSKEKEYETINDFIIKKEPREGEKNFYGSLSLKGIHYLQFAILNRELDEENINYLYEIAKEKFTNTSVINFDGEIIIAVFVNTNEIYGIVIDGQHRLKALERLQNEGTLPENLSINVIVHRITTYQNGFELIKRWNKDAVIKQSQEFNNSLLNELQKLGTSKTPIIGKQRPKIVLEEFINMTKKLNISEKTNVNSFIEKLLEYNDFLHLELEKVIKREMQIGVFCNKYVAGKKMTYDKLKKYAKNDFILGLDNTYSYLNKLV